MPRTLDPELRRALAARIGYYNEMGIYDFYRRPVSGTENVTPCTPATPDIQPELREEMSPRKAAAAAVAVEENMFEVTATRPGLSDPAKALRLIREDLGDCTRCPLHKLGRKQIVFGVGNPEAELMFV